MKRNFVGLLTVLLLVMIGCQKEKSFEISNRPSEGSLQSETTGDCLPKTVNGLYVAATPLVPAVNTITVSVEVTKTGNYTIYSDTINGYFFRGTGVFTTTGTNTVTLRSNGTPFSAGINNFIINYGNTVCDVAITVLPVGSTPAAFTLESTAGNCGGIAVNGSYATATALNFTNTVKVNVNVTAIGTYSISTGATPVNGMTFAAAGIFTTTGVQSVTLFGTGTPAANGNTTVPITAGASTCSFVIPVGNPADGTLGGAPGSCTTASINGTYTSGVLLTTANSVDIQVNVTTLGVYSITTNTVAGIKFAASGSFTTTGPQSLKLNGSGTPTASGPQTFTVTFGTSACTFIVPIAAPAGAAVYTPNCAGATVNGTYKVNTVLTSANTIVIPVTVTTAGTYNISTTVTNGMIFTGSGTLAVGPGTITLVGTGSVPNAAASPSTNIPIPGATSCNVAVTVAPATGGTTAYVPDCTSANIMGLYEATTQLNVSNVIDVDVNVTTAGPYSFTIPAVNGMTFTASGTFTATGPATIRLVGSGTPIAAGSFGITVPGTTPCTFQLIVDATPVVDWKFTVTNPAPTTIYQGQTDDAQLQSSGGFLIFALVGSNSDGTDDFQMALSDLNTINNGETYTTTSTAAFSYAPVTVNGIPAADPYVASPTSTGVSITFTVTSHNTGTKTISGTFSGTAKNSAGQTITITGGTFRGTYL